jgi:hypothetical protein
VNAFIGLKRQPSDEELAAALGPSGAAWGRLLEELAADLQLTESDWHSYSVKAGWALRVKRKERNILYLSPGQGGFVVTFVLGEKALAAARASRLPASVNAILDGARKYAEGTAVYLEVKTARQLAAVKKLAAAKLAH